MHISGGPSGLEAELQQVTDLRRVNYELLVQTEDLLQKEATNNNQLCTQFGARWTIPQSSTLTKNLLDRMNRFAANLKQAVDSDARIERAIREHTPFMSIFEHRPPPFWEWHRLCVGYAECYSFVYQHYNTVEDGSKGDADVDFLANTYFDCRQFRRVAHVLCKQTRRKVIRSQADNLRQQTLQQMHMILTTRQSARALLAIRDYFSRLHVLSSLWLARPHE